MFSKFYEKIKQFIKENYKTLIFFIFLYILFLYPVDYYIITGGGIMEVGSRIRVEDEYKSKGSLNLAYVSEAKGTIATYLLSYIVPDFERIKVTLSINYSEQLAISKILSKFDDKIQQEEFILEKLQNYKKGLLQQMFI